MKTAIKTFIILFTLVTAIGLLFLYNRKQEKIKNNFDVFFSQWKVYGIDVSEYNGNIDWDRVSTIFGEHKIHFAFIRSTAGKDKVDKQFKENWNALKDSNIHLGAYHYYRPDENSLEQAKNFIDNVILKKGDLPPVLDIERQSNVQSMEQLKIGLQKWLDTVEMHYCVKPILYSGSNYFTTFLKKEFTEYPLWIANYNKTKKPVNHDWTFWQYSDKGKVDGIRRKVDVNVFDGSDQELRDYLIKY